MKRRTTTLFILSTLTLPARGQSMKKADIKLNPHPEMGYEVTLTIDDAPGPFDAVEGSAGYQVSNDRCVPLVPIGGARLTPEKNVPIDLTRTSETIYKGQLYVDLLADKDYFRLGLCRWSMPFADFDLQIGNLAFAHSIALQDILAGNSVTRYFNNLSYVSEEARSPKTDHPRVSSGNASRAEFKDPGSTFSMTLSAKEKLP